MTFCVRIWGDWLPYLNSFFDRFFYVGKIKFVHGNFSVSGLPFCIVPVDLLVSLVEKHDIEFERKLYCSVKETVRAGLLKKFGLDFGVVSKEKIIKFSEDFFSYSGWGEIVNLKVEVEGLRAIVRVSNSAVSNSLKTKVNHPVDHFLRGVLAGIFSFAFQRDVDCLELRCAATGLSKDCEFIVKPNHEFNFSKKNVQDQIEAEV